MIETQQWIPIFKNEDTILKNLSIYYKVTYRTLFMNKTEQIKKLQQAKDLILEVRDDYKGFGEYDNLHNIAIDVEEQRAIFEVEN